MKRNRKQIIKDITKVLIFFRTSFFLNALKIIKKTRQDKSNEPNLDVVESLHHKVLTATCQHHHQINSIS